MPSCVFLCLLRPKHPPAPASTSFSLFHPSTPSSPLVSPASPPPRLATQTAPLQLFFLGFSGVSQSLAPSSLPFSVVTGMKNVNFASKLAAQAALLLLLVVARKQTARGQFLPPTPPPRSLTLTKHEKGPLGRTGRTHRAPQHHITPGAHVRPSPAQHYGPAVVSEKRMTTTHCSDQQSFGELERFVGHVSPKTHNDCLSRRKSQAVSVKSQAGWPVNLLSWPTSCVRTARPHLAWPWERESHSVGMLS